MNSTAFKLRKKKKLLIITPMIVLFSTEVGYARIDPNQLFSDDSSSFAMTDTSTSAQKVVGNADTLLGALYNDASRGESLDRLKESQSRFGSSWLGSSWNWSDPEKEVTRDSDGNGSSLPPLNAKELDLKKKKQLDNLKQTYLSSGLYDSDYAALAALNADIKAVQERIDLTKNLNLRAKLESLLGIAKTFSKQLNGAIMRYNINEMKKGQMPSDGVSLSKSLSEFRESLDRENDPNLRGIYQEVIKQLEAIDSEVKKLTRQNDGLLDETVKRVKELLAVAERNQSRNPSPAQAAQITMYKEIFAQLQIDIREEEAIQRKQAEEIAEIDRLVEEKMTDVSHPKEALEMAKTQLNALHGDLQILKNLRRGQAQITEKEKAIDRCNRIIEALEIKLREREQDEKLIDKRVEELVKKYNGDVERAFDEINLKVNPIGRAKSTHRIDVGALEALRFQLESERIAEEKRIKDSVEMSLVVQRNLDLSNDPIDALAIAEEKFMDLQSELTRLQSYRSPMTEIKAKQTEIDKQSKIIEALSIKAESERAENRKVDIKMNELLAKHSNDSTKALKEAQNKINNIGRGQMVNPLDQKVVQKLTRRVQEDKDYAKENDPVNIALDQLNRSKVVDIPKALEAVIAALLLKAGITMDKLSDRTRQDLANVLRVTSDRLIDIMNNPRISESERFERKHKVVKEMIKDSGLLIISYKTGASQEALVTRDPLTIGLDMLLNNYLLTDSMGAGANFADDYNFDFGASDPKTEAYKTLGVMYGASIREITLAYKRLALQYHPDKGGDRDKFQAISNAYDLLTKDKQA